MDISSLAIFLGSHIQDGYLFLRPTENLGEERGSNTFNTFDELKSRKDINLFLCRNL